MRESVLTSVESGFCPSFVYYSVFGMFTFWFISVILSETPIDNNEWYNNVGTSAFPSNNVIDGKLKNQYFSGLFSFIWKCKTVQFHMKILFLKQMLQISFFF